MRKLLIHGLCHTRQACYQSIWECLAVCCQRLDLLHTIGAPSIALHCAGWSVVYREPSVDSAAAFPSGAAVDAESADATAGEMVWDLDLFGFWNLTYTSELLGSHISSWKNPSIQVHGCDGSPYRETPARLSNALGAQTDHIVELEDSPRAEALG